MAGRQDSTRSRSIKTHLGVEENKILIHSLDDAMQVMAYSVHEQKKVTLTNPEHSVYYLGLGYIKMAIDLAARAYPDARYEFICDVVDNACFAQAAMRMGFKTIKFSGSAQAYQKLLDIAGYYDVKIICGQAA